LVLNHLNLNINLAKTILKNIRSIRGRGNIIKIDKNISIIDDSYNSNPVSLKKSISEFHDFKTKKRKILVLGDMLELGKFSKLKHLEIGKFLKLFKFDRIYLVGDKSKQIYKQIKSTFWCKYCENINVFSREFKNVLMENSIIMFKASNGVGLNKLLNKKIYKC
jgi:UDP-N-acetylmuramyl pentapeptide synthase